MIPRTRTAHDPVCLADLTPDELEEALASDPNTCEYCWTISQTRADERKRISAALAVLPVVDKEAALAVVNA